MIDFINKAMSSLFGSKSDRDLKDVKPLVAQINEEYAKLQNLSHDELRSKTQYFQKVITDYLKEINTNIDELKASADIDPAMDADDKEKIYNEVDKLIKDRDAKLEEVLNQILPQAFAVVKETSRRLSENETIEVTASELDKSFAAQGKDFLTITGDKAIYKNTWNAAGTPVKWNMVHYDVQLIGGVILHQGKIAEMATGEGKTLVATLPAYLNGLSGYGVHIVTVNDYLAKRDSEWNGPLFNFLGLTVDCIDKHEPHSEARQQAYKANITYGTNNEFGFDYLRDNMVRNTNELVQGKLHFAMVDEVDSVLVDDARTPLIISGPIPKGDEQEFFALKPRIYSLVEAQKRKANQFLIDAKKLIEQGKTDEKTGGLSLLRAHRALPRYAPLIKYLSEQGNRQILQKAENYYLQDQQKNMPLVDEELLFVIEEKQNSVELTDKGIEQITQSGEDAHFFVMPDVGSEVAEIEKKQISDEEKLQLKDKLMQDFAVKSERLHSVQQLLKAYTLFEKDVEYVVMDSKVKIVDENTGRILDGRRYSDGLHQAIEAKENVKVEAATQTFATVTLQNYFRMYHKLCGMTGTAITEANELWEIYKLDVVEIPTNQPITRKDLEDLVYKTKREKYNATIDHVVELSNAGRPVLVGTTSVEISELLSRMLKMKGIKHNVLNAKQHQKEADIVAEAGKPGAVTIATNMAGRGTDIKIGAEVKAAGGLAIVGTERHESRRVDRQLRGRAGRQGDPGSSQFFVSLEDDLMRLFGSERIASLMDRMGYKEGEVIQHSMVSKSIERAQKKVEENNFGTRKRLLEYDDVMNSQREVIYTKRRNALFGDRLSVDLNNMFYDLCEELVTKNQDDKSYENFKLDVIRFFATDTHISEQEFLSGKLTDIVPKLYHEVKESYKRKSEHIVTEALPFIKHVFENNDKQFTNAMFPFTDGTKGINVVVNLEKAIESQGKEIVTAFEKNISLALIDDAWKEHLREMDELKQSVQSAVYEQKDPLLIYKFEAFNLFKSMVSNTNKDVCSFLFRGVIPIQKPEEVKQAKEEQTDMKKLKTSRTDDAGSSSSSQTADGKPADKDPKEKFSNKIREQLMKKK
jgi:preprotein translocase subunit SecA